MAATGNAQLPSSVSNSFRGLFKDRRIELVASNLMFRMFTTINVSLRRLAGCRKDEVAFGRLLKNPKFEVEKVLTQSFEKSSEIAKDTNHVLLIQDTVFLCYGKRGERKVTGLGVGGNEYALGFYVHPVLAVDPDKEVCLGLAAVHHWAREEKTETEVNKIRRRHHQPITEKESYRWIDCANKAKKVFDETTMKTVIADRESDIYEEFCLVPDEHTHLLTRSSHNRHLINGKRLFETLDKAPIQGSYRLKLPAITGVRKARIATLDVRFLEVEIKKPDRTLDSLPKTTKMFAIDICERGSSKNKIHWRLLTTHAVTSLEKAIEIISWYKQRWHIEQLFRTMKKQGLKVEDSLLTTYNSLHKMCLLALVCAVDILKLSIAREGKTKRPLTDVFESSDRKFFQKINKRVQGNTRKQMNPHKIATLAWASWVIARLGGWSGYSCEHPPGPITMRRGLEEFLALKRGVAWLT